MKNFSIWVFKLREKLRLVEEKPLTVGKEWLVLSVYISNLDANGCNLNKSQNENFKINQNGDALKSIKTWWKPTKTCIDR